MRLFTNITFLILLTLSIFLGCDTKPKMDRDKARILIIETLNIPFNETRVLISGNFRINNWMSTECNISRSYPGEQGLFNQGFREITGYAVPSGQLAFQDCIYTVKLTEKAQQYIVQTVTSDRGEQSAVKVSEVNFGDMKTFREISDNEYEIEFTLVRTHTPFAEPFNNSVLATTGQYSDPVGKPGPVDCKARILRYDQGWQIATEDLDRIKRKFESNKNQ